jgi:NAD(P)-dependent dehydrogenase (short-subunit alcohol dehydrogenase family)
MQAVADSYALKRIAEPAEIAGAICYLASDLAANITGAALAIDGGSTAGR